MLRQLLSAEEVRLVQLGPAPTPVRGVTETAVDGAPAPALFTARTMVLYPVQLLRPEISMVVAVEAGLTAVQLAPLLVEYW